MTKRQLLEKLAGLPSDTIITVCHRDEHLAPRNGYQENNVKEQQDRNSGDAIDAQVVPGRNRLAIVY